MLTNSIYRIETIWINRMIKGQQFLIGETCIQIVCRSDSLYHEDFIVSWLAIRFEFGVRSTVDFQAEFLVGHLWYNLSMNNMSLTQKSMAALAYWCILKHSKICPTLVGKAFHFPLILPKTSQNTNPKHVVVVASTWSNIRLYYWNQATNETTWIRPGAPMMPLNPGFQPFFYPQ